jgi:hypothetical protein
VADADWPTLNYSGTSTDTIMPRKRTNHALWVGSIRLRVSTRNQAGAGTDRLVTCTIVRDDEAIVALKLDHPNIDDMEPGKTNYYDFIGPEKIALRPDTLKRQRRDRIESKPTYGIEFAKGVKGHLSLQFKVHGEDVWVKDAVDLFIREIKPLEDSKGQIHWVEDKVWTHVASWGRDIPLSATNEKAFQALTLKLKK